MKCLIAVLGAAAMVVAVWLVWLTAAVRMNLRSSRLAVLESVRDHAVRSYRRLLTTALRRRGLVIGFSLWLFGLPAWMLPERIESEGIAAGAYNATFGSEAYRAATPYVDHALGGTSHIFFTKLSKGEVWDFGRDTYLVLGVSFPQGTEIERCDQIARDIERLVLGNAGGVERMTSRVHPEHAVVRIDIEEAAANTAFPFELKNRLVLFAAQTGGATISVAGFGPGFYSGRESTPSFHVKVLGYNYARVRDIADQFRESIERNPRIADVDIDRSFGRWNKMYELVTSTLLSLIVIPVVCSAITKRRRRI